jgi:hypothetical protein
VVFAELELTSKRALDARPRVALLRRVVELAMDAQQIFEGHLLVGRRLEEITEGPIARHDSERVDGL